jgi:N-acetylmuramoyl-L-alanine amidase
VLFGLGVVDVADGDGEGVGCVGGPGNFVELEQAGDHELDLLLGGEAVADDGAFDGEGGVFGDEEAAVGGGHHGDSTDLAELESALSVGREEDFFDGDDLGLPELEEGRELGVDLEESDRGAVLFVKLDGAGAEVAELWVAGGLVDLDYAIAGKFRSAIDSKDPHRYESNARQSSRDEVATDRHLIRYKQLRPLQSTRHISIPKGRRPLLNFLRHAATPCLVALATWTSCGQTATPKAVQQTAAVKPQRTAALAPQKAPKPVPQKAPPVASPLPGPVTVPINRMVILLDPGHGGLDSGSRISDATLEKDVTLALAFRLRSLLSARGFAVVMTRDADSPSEPNAEGTPLTLDDRAGIANHTHAAACLLLHATGSGNGVHLYHSELRGTEGSPAVQPWLTAQAAWVSQSQRLETELATALTRAGVALVTSSGSVRPVDSLSCPALVFELAPQGDDSDSINDADYQQRIAGAIAGAMVFWRNQVVPPQQLTVGATAANSHTALENQPTNVGMQP